MKLMISDVYEGIKAAKARMLSATWRRCRGHFQRNALVHAGKSNRRVVSAFIVTAVSPPDHDAARGRGRLAADQLRGKLPKLAAHGLNRRGCPFLHDLSPIAPGKVLSTNPIKRLNGKIKRRTDTVGILPN